jgi:hypothetical protein
MLARYAKAIAALLGTGITAAITTALADGSISGLEWLGIIAAVLGTTGATAAVPNRPAPRLGPSVHDGPVVG